MLPAAMTPSTPISSQLQVLAATVAVPAAEADADSDTMQSILSVLPEAVRDAVMEHLQSRQAAALSQGLVCYIFFMVSTCRCGEGLTMTCRCGVSYLCIFGFDPEPSCKLHT